MGVREDPIHIAVLQLARLMLPGAVIHHSPNELTLAGEIRARKIAQARSDRMGRLKGYPDLIVIWRGQTVGLEVKAPNGRLTPEQREVGEAFRANGASWCEVRSVDTARVIFEAMKERAANAPVVAIPLRGVVG